MGNGVEDATIKKGDARRACVGKVIFDRFFQHQRGVAFHIQPWNCISAASNLLLDDPPRGLRNAGKAATLQFVKNSRLANTRTACNHKQAVVALIC